MTPMTPTYTLPKIEIAIIAPKTAHAFTNGCVAAAPAEHCWAGVSSSFHIAKNAKKPEQSSAIVLVIYTRV